MTTLAESIREELERRGFENATVEEHGEEIEVYLPEDPEYSHTIPRENLEIELEFQKKQMQAHASIHDALKIFQNHQERGD